MAVDSNATPGGAPAPAASAASPSNASVNEPVLDELGAAAGFTAEDFRHPDYGVKAKNLYAGFQKGAESRKKAERDLAELQTFLRTHPYLSKATRAAVAEANGEKVEWDKLYAEPAPSSPPPSPAGNEEPSNNGRGDVEAAMSELYAHLGKGDPYAGRSVYEKEWHDKMMAVLPSINPSMSPRDRIRQAMELIRYRDGSSNPPPTGTASGESGRAAAAPPPPPKNETEEQFRRRVLAEAGFNNELEYARAVGAI